MKITRRSFSGLALVAGVAALVPLRGGGDPVLAGEPPPSPPPVIAPVDPVDAAAAQPPGALCEATLAQALAELDYWRSQVAPLILPPSPKPAGAGHDLTTLAQAIDRPRLGQVASALKEMKAPAVAAVIAGWDDAFATQVLGRLPARASGAIAAALPPEHAARLLARLSLLALSEEVP